MPLAAAPPPKPPPAYAFAWGSLSLAGETSSFRQRIGFDYMRRDVAGPPFVRLHWWVLHRVTQPNPALRREEWVDGRACPGLDAAMRALAAQPAPRFSDPSDAEGQRLTRRSADGTDFVLEGQGALPLDATADPPFRATPLRLQIESNDEGPLASWFSQLDLATRTCWSSSPPAP